MSMNSAPLETPGIHNDLSLRIKLRRIIFLRWEELIALIKEAVNNYLDHNVPRLSASVAFYTLLSLSPLLIIVVAVAGAFFGKDAAEGRLVWQIQDLIGRDGAETIQTLLKGAQKPTAGVLTTMFGLLTLFYGAGTVVAELRDAMNTIWCVQGTPTTGLGSIVAIIKDRTFAFGVVLGIGFLLLVSLAVNAALSALGERFSASLPVPPWSLRILDFAFTYIVITVLFAVMYKWIPNLYIEWRDVILGAMMTSLLFGLGKYLIGVYLGTAGVGSTFGAAGSLVVVLLWVYYSAQIFFLGAEFTRAYAQLFGSHPCDVRDKKVHLTGSPEHAEGREPPSLIIRP